MIRIVGSDVGGIAQAFIYSFNNGECLYVTNDKSLCLDITNDEGDLCPSASIEELTGDTWRRIINEETNHYIETTGYIDGSGFYRDWQSFDICIGYFNVSRENKTKFDAAIESLRVLRVTSKVKNIRKKETKVLILTPQSVNTSGHI